MTYSQRGEEDFLLFHYDGFNGYFLDIGAYDGRCFSNTLALAKQGWGGVLVEPAAQPFHRLTQIYETEEKMPLERFEFINAIVGVEAKPLVRWYQCDDAISSTDEEHVKLWRENQQSHFVSVLAPQISMEQLLTETGSEFDLIDIDTEGTSVDLLAEFCRIVPATRWPKVWIVEHDGRAEEVHKILFGKGYVQQYFSGENIIMVAKGIK